MYQQIKEHILEGKLKLAFEEIAALDLSRDQRDELIKAEARYNRLQRESGQMTAEMRGIESERINDRVLKLINWVSDEAAGNFNDGESNETSGDHEEIPVVPVGPRIKQTGDGSARHFAKSRKPNIPILITVGVALILAVIWASGLIGWGDDDNSPGASKGNVGKAEIVEQDEPREPNNSGGKTATINYEALKKAGAVPEGREIDAKQLSINTERIVDALGKSNEKQTIGFVYVTEGRLLGSTREGSHNLLLAGLAKALPDYEMSKVDADNSRISKSEFENLKQGKYDGGKIAGIEQDYLIIISARRSSNQIVSPVEYRNTAYRVSDGSLIMSNSRSLKGSDKKSTVTDFVASKFETWKQKN